MIKKPLYRYDALDSGGLCKLFRHPDVSIPSGGADVSPQQVQDFIDNALMSPSIYALGRNPRHEAFIFAPSHNAVTFQAHMAVHPDHRNGAVVGKTIEAGIWIFDNTPAKAIMCFIREDNKGMRSVLGQMGMKQIGKTNQTICFDGEWQDEIIYQCTELDARAAQKRIQGD